VNSPWRQWVFERLRELCAYPIDGIFFDGPVFFDDCCYCAHCKAKFAARCGEAMPRKDAHREDGRLPALVEFQSDSICDFVRAARNVIKSINPGFLFYVNANPLQPSRITARDNRKLAACADVLASEGGFLGGDLIADGPIWKVGFNAKMLETQAGGAAGVGGAAARAPRVPHLVFDSVIHTPWTYATLPAAEARLLWASSVAHGAGTWMSAYKDSMHRPAVSAVGELYDFARRHRGALFDTRSLANVAIVCSSATMNYYDGADVPGTDFTAAHAADRPGNVTRELYGWYHALWTAHVPFDVIDETEIEAGDLAAYRVIVLPNVACMSDRCAQRLKRFVAAGGTLVASFQAGMYDAQGLRRAGAAGALDELFGIRRGDDAVEGPRRWDYLFDHRRRGGGGVETCMPSPAFALNVTAAPRARSLLTFSRPLPDRYAGLPADSGRAAVVRHETIPGTTFYFACDFGAAMWKWRMPEHLAIVKEIIAHHADPPLQLLDAPPCLDVSLRRSNAGNSVVLHLVNYNGGMTRPIERVLPIHDLTVRVRLQPRSVRTLFRPAPLQASMDGDWTTVRLPRLHEYEAIEFQVST
jgi:hypothetical protein